MLGLGLSLTIARRLAYILGGELQFTEPFKAGSRL
jgi:C4-dicarboxylate-specific signal transduction histidine kinase